MCNSSKNLKKLIIIGGPTASGKTKFAIEVAKYYNTEIISADSRQIYKELNIGVAVPDDSELLEAKHHFIHSHSIHCPLNAYDYSIQSLDLISNLFKTNDILVMTGGSGLFLKAVYHGIDLLPDPTPELRNELNQIANYNYESLLKKLLDLDPEYYQIVDKNNSARVKRALEVCLTSGEKYSKLRKNQARNFDFQILKFAIKIERSQLDYNISKRLNIMRENGLTSEAKNLYEYRKLSPLQTIGYTELFDYFDGLHSEDEAFEKIRINTRRYAKKQESWLRRENCFEMLEYENENKLESLIEGIY